jgi:hypothetical protein
MFFVPFSGEEDRRQHRLPESEAEAAGDLRLHQEREAQGPHHTGDVVRERHVQRRHRAGAQLSPIIPCHAHQNGWPDLFASENVHPSSLMVFLAVWPGQRPLRRRGAERVRTVPWQVLVRDVQPQEGGAQEEPPHRVHVPVPSMGRQRQQDWRAQARLPFRLYLALPCFARPEEMKKTSPVRSENE